METTIVFSIVIPVYNEESAIKATLLAVSRYFSEKGLAYEIIAVNDGSRDSSAALIKEIADNDRNIRLITDSVNRGKGQAVRKGVIAARGQIIAYYDADMSVPVSDLGRMLEDPFAREGIIIAVRDRKDRSTRIVRPPIRTALNFIYNMTVNALLGLGLKDANCGCKSFPAKTAKELFATQYIKGWLFDAELMMLARRKGAAIKEVPVSWTNHFPSHVSIIKDSAVSLAVLIGLFLRSLKLDKYYG